MRSKSDHQKDTFSGSGAKRPECPGIGPAPLVEVKSAVAEHPRETGCPGSREQTPAAFVPQRIIMGGVSAPRWIGHQVFDHLFLVDWRPLLQIIDALYVVGCHSQGIEPSAIEIAVLIKKWREHLQFCILQGTQFVTRCTVKGWRPEFL